MMPIHSVEYEGSEESSALTVPKRSLSVNSMALAHAGSQVTQIAQSASLMDAVNKAQNILNSIQTKDMIFFFLNHQEE